VIMNMVHIGNSTGTRVSGSSKFGRVPFGGAPAGIMHRSIPRNTLSMSSMGIND
jgi:hypothetical protein